MTGMQRDSVVQQSHKTNLTLRRVPTIKPKSVISVMMIIALIFKQMTKRRFH